MFGLPRHSSLLAATLALALAPAAPAAAAGPHRARTARACASADTSAVGVPAATLRSAVICLINRQRAHHHLPALRESRQLDRSAQGWSNAMVHTGQFTHGADFAARISSAGYLWSTAGENIATGFETPRQVVDGWMASTGHCENILAPNFSDVGTGVNPAPLGIYGSATWTQDFGLWMGHPVPSRNSAPAQGCPYRVS